MAYGLRRWNWEYRKLTMFWKQKFFVWRLYYYDYYYIFKSIIQVKNIAFEITKSNGYNPTRRQIVYFSVAKFESKI